ncbi:MAG: hypothetical protein P9L99_13835 [Candidatus Lernaella stagnicola]|nr:hypothetical protein [Candidatus Lernaella stagnicola]
MKIRAMWWMMVVVVIALLVAMFACGDDDDDDDSGDDDDNDTSEPNCVDEARPLAEAYCEELGLTDESGAGLGYSIAECGVICPEYYYDGDCADGLCICCK